jgi:hypothetical protein
MALNAKQVALCAQNEPDFSALSAVILNCTLERPEERSHTDLLLSVPAGSCATPASRWNPAGRRG